jgi:hypothetical protein
MRTTAIASNSTPLTSGVKKSPTVKLVIVHDAVSTFLYRAVPPPEFEVGNSSSRKKL